MVNFVGKRKKLELEFPRGGGKNNQGGEEAYAVQRIYLYFAGGNRRGLGRGK